MPPEPSDRIVCPWCHETFDTPAAFVHEHRLTCEARATEEAKIAALLEPPPEEPGDERDPNQLPLF